MTVIGIITNNENSIGIEEKITNKEITVIQITKENIENIKNLKLDIVVIYEEIGETDKIKKVIQNSKIAIVNSDYKDNLKLINKNRESYVITFGYNSRASITIVSNENEEIILEIQREIQFENEKIECQEIKMENNFAKKELYREISVKILTFLLKI